MLVPPRPTAPAGIPPTTPTAPTRNRSSIFPFHLFCAYLVFASGAACLVTRAVRPLAPAHKWCGRVYIVAMLWATGTSLLIHNTGLPIAVLWSFLWALGGLTIGAAPAAAGAEAAAGAARQLRGQGGASMACTALSAPPPPALAAR